ITNHLFFTNSPQDRFSGPHPCSVKITCDREERQTKFRHKGTWITSCALCKAWITRCDLCKETCSRKFVRLIEPDVLEVDRQVVDAACRRSDPVCKLTRFNDTSHQGTHERMILVRGKPRGRLPLPILF